MSYIGLEHMPRRCIALSDWESDTKLGSNKLEFKRGEILFGKLRPYFHKVGVAPLDGVCSTDILVVRPKKPEWFGFVLGHVSSVELVNHTDAASTGTKMPRTNWNDLARFEVALPPESLAAEFTAMIRPMIDRIIANIHESRTLAELRQSNTNVAKLARRTLEVEVRTGDRVRLHPRKGGDVLDIALEGQLATAESIEEDDQGNSHLGVVLDDDPGRDLGLLRQPGHRFFFSSLEVEPLRKEEHRQRAVSRKPRSAGRRYR